MEKASVASRAVSSSWSTPGNWVENVAPTNGKSLVFDTTTVGFAGTAAAFAPNNDIAGLNDITFGGRLGNGVGLDTPESLAAFAPKAVILSGGPASVTEDESPRVTQKVFELVVPVLAAALTAEAV